jgi:hypothetical protein
VILIISSTLFDGFGDALAKGADPLVLEFEADLIGDEPRADGTDDLNDVKVVFLERRARLDESTITSESPGSARARWSRLFNDVDSPPLPGIEVVRDAGKLRGHAQRPVQVVPEALPGRDAHTALADAEVQKLVDVGQLLEQDVLSDDARSAAPRST